MIYVLWAEGSSYVTAMGGLSSASRFTYIAKGREEAGALVFDMNTIVSVV
jgi:NADH:ubiquinone oxidoreductase subunit H